MVAVTVKVVKFPSCHADHAENAGTIRMQITGWGRLWEMRRFAKIHSNKFRVRPRCSNANSFCGLITEFVHGEC